MLDLMYSILKPLKTVNVLFVAFRLAIQYKLQFNAQIIYLEHYLNDLYDPAKRDIYIEDTANIEFNYLYNTIENRPPIYLFNNNNIDSLYNSSETSSSIVSNASEASPLYLGSLIGMPFYFLNNSEYANQVDYIVMVPVGISYNELLMRKQILTYNQAGKRFNINTY